MLKTCEQYANDHDIIFNAKKLIIVLWLTHE